jgi:hypothetical protein
MDSTQLKTSARLHKFESRNLFQFNNTEEQALLETRVAPIQYSLHDRAEDIFKIACDRIARSEFSPLCNAMIANRCNKPIAHNYTQAYHELLASQRDDHLGFAEVGIGTPNQDVPSAMAPTYPFGSSLRGWRTYLTNPKTTIFGGDIDPRVLFTEDRINTFYLNQLNPTSIVQFQQKSGLFASGIDFFLDDGLHEFRSNLTLLLLVWPNIKKNGLYLIEDMAENTFANLMSILQKLSLNAIGIGIELPSTIKSDNRILALQKLG